MADIIIGGARHDENNKYNGGQAGDQTNTEVAFRAMYNHSKGWYILRPKSVDHANKIATAMIAACNNNHIGYSMDVSGRSDSELRTGLYSMYKKYGSIEKITENCNTDCSATVRVCVMQGTGIDPGNFTTANEASALESTGLFATKVKYVNQSSTPVYNGDVLVTCTKGHTEIVVSGNPRTTTSSSDNRINGYTYGMDISKYQGNINFDLMKNSPNSEFVILRACHGFSKDAKFEEYYANCKSRNIPLGAYCYNSATNIEDAKKEAQYFLSLCKGKKFDCGLWLDMEDKTIRSIENWFVISCIIMTEAQILLDAGFKVGVYCNKDWYKNVLNGTNLEKFLPLWIAGYGANTGQIIPSNRPSYGMMWQYTSKGVVDGITANVVDLDECKGNLVDIMKNFKYQQNASTTDVVKPAESGTCPYPKPTRTLKLGAKGDDVKWLQWNLRRIGDSAMTVDGDFGKHTDQCLRFCQGAWKITVDGIVGPKTIEMILKN